jgi:hypothetical protein
MNDMLLPFLERFVLVFFDDILIYIPSWDEHLQHVCWGEGKDATLRSRPSLQPPVRQRQSEQGHPSQDSAL